MNNRTSSGTVIQISDLKERQARAWDTINAMDTPPSALVAHSMQRLTLLIEKAEPILQAGIPAQNSEAMRLPGSVVAENKPSLPTKS